MLIWQLRNQILKIESHSELDTDVILQPVSSQLGIGLARNGKKKNLVS